MRAVGGDPIPGRDDPFLRAPHRTLVRLALPVLGALVTEPVTGLVDTAFVARLGSEALAALGVGAIVLSSLFWIFNFLSIGTQTEVARARGAGEPEAGREACGLALCVAVAVGALLALVGLVAAGPAAGAMGATGAVREAAADYVAIRLVGAPAVLVTITAFGALRGVQDMRTPLWIAVGVNALNVALDPLLIFGAGPVPGLGVAGAAWASTASQWLGGVAAFRALRRRLGLPRRLRLAGLGALFVVGRDLFVRTGLLTGFLLLMTRSATRSGAEAGAAHQAVRQVWLLSALVLDAFAHTAQSLVGSYHGAGDRPAMRRVAEVATAWSAGVGLALAAGMLLAEGLAARALVPASAGAAFAAAWRVAALSQPVNAMSFATDGLHWGTGDYRYLRNAMAVATGFGALALAAVDARGPGALATIWWVAAGWIAVRAGLGLARVWPGVGRSPFREGATGDRPEPAARRHSATGEAE